MATKNQQNSQSVVTVPGGPQEPFVRYAEADAPGAGSQLAEPPESARRRAKGDLGDKSRTPPKALTGPKPYTMTKGGR